MARENHLKTLSEALERMRFEVLPGRFALLGFGEPLTDEDLALLHGEPAQAIRERGETTLLVAEARAAEVLARHPHARVERPLAWIRFEAPMDWELVGFLAHVSSALAEAGVPLGAVCGYSRDHLFVAERHLPRAREVLGRLFPHG